MAAPFDPRTGASGTPRGLFSAAVRGLRRTCYDVAPDGRFLFVLDEEAQQRLRIIRDWTALLGPGER